MHPNPSRTRTYATAGLDADARTALRCMMDVLKGRTRAEWTMGDAGAAELVFVGAQAGNAGTAGARHVVRVARPGEGTAGFALQMDYPFRVFQLLSVMQEVEDESADDTNPPATATAAVSHPSWALFDSLHLLCVQAGNGERWHRVDGEDADATLYVRDDLRRCAATAAMRDAILDGRLPQSPLAPAEPPEPGLAEHDAERLLWHVGLLAGRGQLSGTLDASATYRLRAWPDFGRFGARPEHLRLSALLTAGSHGRDELVAALGPATPTAAENVNRFLNACAASGLLRAEHRVAPPPRAPAGFVGGIVARLRQRLGLGNEAAR